MALSYITVRYFVSKVLSEFICCCRRVLFVTEISILGIYDIEWKMDYVDLHELPKIVSEKQSIQILVKVRKYKFYFDINFVFKEP